MMEPNQLTTCAQFFAQCLSVAPGPGTAQSADVVTVVFDLHNPLGKKFWVVDGEVNKEAAVSTAWAAAMTFHVPDAQIMCDLLTLVGDCQHAAIINARFPAVPINTEFRIASRKQITKLLGLGIDTDAVHAWQGMVMVARVMAQTSPSTWQLIDRDVDEHTPQAMAVGYEEWLGVCDQVLPGLIDTTRVVMPSASSRVLRDGIPLSAGNGHTWVRIADAADAERARAAILARSIELGLAWLKPRYSRETGEMLNGRGMWCCPLDQSVWSVGRLTFDGRPMIGEGLELAPSDIAIISGKTDRLDTSRAVINTVETFRASRKRGTAVRIKTDGATASIIVDNLTMATVLELEGSSTTTVAQLMATTPVGEKVRCQAPFRASQSMAAFFAVNGWGQPRVYDVGTGCLHVLKREALVGDAPQMAEVVGRAVAAIRKRFDCVEEAELAVNVEALVATISGVSWHPGSGKVVMFNDRGGLVTISERDFSEFAMRSTFGGWLDADPLMPMLDAIEDDKARKEAAKWLKAYESSLVLREAKIHRQFSQRFISVDMFATRPVMSFEDGRMNLIYPFKPLRCDSTMPECTEAVIAEVAADYARHWPMIDEWLDAMTAARFAADRRKAFYWLNAPASWGKGFFTDLLRNQGLLFSVSVKEVEAALAGQPAGLSSDEALHAWTIFVDEWKSVSRELKELNSRMTFASKGQPRTTVPLYVKLFASAEGVSSLTTGGVEHQFAERFSILTPKSEGRLDDRPTFDRYGKAVYFEAMLVHIGRALTERVAHYRSLGPAGAAHLADRKLDDFHTRHGIGQLFGSIDDEAARVAEGLLDAVARYLRQKEKGPLGFSDSVTLGQSLTKILNAAQWGYVSLDGDRKLGLVTGNAEALVRAFLVDEGTAPAQLTKLGYKASKIVDEISIRSDEPIRIYKNPDRATPGAGDHLKTKKRGRVIFARDGANND